MIPFKCLSLTRNIHCERCSGFTLRQGLKLRAPVRRHPDLCTMSLASLYSCFWNRERFCLGSRTGFSFPPLTQVRLQSNQGPECVSGYGSASCQVVHSEKAVQTKLLPDKSYNLGFLGEVSKSPLVHKSTEPQIPLQPESLNLRQRQEYICFTLDVTSRPQRRGLDGILTIRTQCP